jgi:hypothetical protein
MRAADAFGAGMITGAVVAWLWGKEIQDFLGAKTREVRTQAADAIGAVEDTIRA